MPLKLVKIIGNISDIASIALQIVVHKVPFVTSYTTYM